MENLSSRVVYRMRKLGLTPTSLAKKMGKQQSTLNSLVSGRSKTFRDMTKLAVALVTSEQWLLTGRGPEESDDAAVQDLLDINKNKKSIRNDESSLQLIRANVSGSSPYHSDLVPLLGNANGSSEALMLNFEDPIGQVPRHPQQLKMNGSFAVNTRGDSMYPRYKSGDLVYAIANKPASKEQDCIVELHDGESYLKEFVKQTDKEIICRQFNPEKEWKRPLSEIKAIHAVVGRG